MTAIASIALSNSFEYGSWNRNIKAENGLMEIKNRSPDKLILGHLNINSFRENLDSLKNALARSIDTETKLDELLLSYQFKIDGFIAPYRFDRNSKGGWVAMYIREDIPSHQLFANSNVKLR